MENLDKMTSLDPSHYFDAALLKMKELHDKKNADYANPKNPFSNFQLSAAFANISTYQTFEVLLGVKQARLLELQKSKAPRNESIEDTYLDRAVYAVLAYCYYKETHNSNG